MLLDKMALKYFKIPNFYETWPGVFYQIHFDGGATSHAMWLIFYFGAVVGKKSYPSRTSHNAG